MNYFVLFLRENRVRVAHLPWGKDGPPLSCIYQGRQYRRLAACGDIGILSAFVLGDYDHLVSPDNRLAGFAFTLGARPEMAAEIEALPLVQAQNTRLEEGGLWLKFILAEAPDLMADGTQGVSLSVYFDGSSDYILLMDDIWPAARGLAFSVEEPEVPAFD